jgi:uncharacterized membrane protein
MDEFKDGNWWTSERRAWLYKIAVALVPLLVAVGLVTQDIAALILNVVAALLAVGAGGMALTNVTPDNVWKIAVTEEQDGTE